MNKTEAGPDPAAERAGPTDAQASPPTATAGARIEARRWWLKLFAQPLLLLAVGAALIAGLGVAQRLGWISAGGAGPSHHVASAGDDGTRYICPMMCTPPQTEPGRCPVCAMELVPATSGGGETDLQSVEVAPAARRVANIRTATVKSAEITHTIRAIGELSYDEGSLKTLAAYVDGRLDRLYADYTGVVVERGDHLALLYSPQLYSAQVELLLAKKAYDQSQPATLQRVVDSNRDLYLSSRQRLIEWGMTQQQIDQFEQAGQASSRMHLCAPISGTVIRKCATEGQYVKEGQAIYELADLSTVWLMLELFPEDAAAIRYGQKVEAEVQSLPGRTIAGRVAFVDPTVDPTKRTVGVRVVIPNGEGLLRVGDYAKAMIQAPVGTADGSQGKIYDPELANKWIDPRHPHIVQSSPGKCPVCGVELVPASHFGFTDKPTAAREALVVPRSAVLMAGNHSVAYVETKAGRFEIRQVVLGVRSGDQVVVLQGLKEGEQVATSGNFLIDSQMQLAGKPSLIDPTKAEPAIEFRFDDGDLPPIGTPQMAPIEITAVPRLQPPVLTGLPVDQAAPPGTAEALAQLSPEDRRLAERQKVCPVADTLLGSMGTPIKVDVNGRPVFICCEGCRASLLAEPAKYLAKLDKEVVR